MGELFINIFLKILIKIYIIWRFSCIGLKRPWVKNSFSRNTKEFIKILLGSKNCIPSKNHKVYVVDNWTKEELKLWGINCQDIFLYPEIKIDTLFWMKKKKKKQVSVFGRITPNKSIEDSIRIFAIGTKKNFPRIQFSYFWEELRIRKLIQNI